MHMMVCKKKITQMCLKKYRFAIKYCFYIITSIKIVYIYNLYLKSLMFCVARLVASRICRANERPNINLTLVSVQTHALLGISQELIANVWLVRLAWGLIIKKRFRSYSNSLARSLICGNNAFFCIFIGKTFKPEWCI